MNKARMKNEKRKKRALRVRAHVSGSAQKPRLSVYRSLTNIYAQLIDDTTGRTLVCASGYEISSHKKNTKDAAADVGKLLAKKAVALGIHETVFDKSFYKFHGRIKALAQAAREHGLQL